MQTAKVARQLPVRESSTLVTIMFCSKLLFAASPKQKDGQYIQRKRVPIIAKVLELVFASAFD